MARILVAKQNRYILRHIRSKSRPLVLHEMKVVERTSEICYIQTQMVFLKYESTSVYLVHASENRILPYDSTQILKSIFSYSWLKFIYSWLKYRNSSVFTCKIDSKYRCKINSQLLITRSSQVLPHSYVKLRYVSVVYFCPWIIQESVTATEPPRYYSRLDWPSAYRVTC